MSARRAGRRPEWDRSAVYVGGRWRATAHGRTIEVENPATEAVTGTAADAGAEDAAAAVSAAAAAFPSWSAMPPHERLAVLGRVHTALEHRRDLLVETTVAELGAPLRVAREAHIDTGLDVLRAYLDAAGDLAWEERVGNSLVLREGIGVAACVTPWNYPFYQVLAKIGGALAAGAAVVLKPAELTPLSAYLLTDAIDEAGVPPGVFNLVPGPGRVVGEALAGHPDVDAISFTGSTRVGARVAAVAAAGIKRVSLELGGKSASVVLPGADLETAVRASVDAAMLNSGQTCTAWTRLLVPRADLEPALRLAAAHADALIVGDPARSETDLGPVASAPQRRTVTGFVERAGAAGARIVTGGAERPAGLPRGHYVRPTVVTDVAADAEIVQEEVFGPVLTVQPYDGVEEAVALANGTPYGLAGAVWGPDRDAAVAVARRLRTGQVDVNGGAFNPAAPFGGYGRSGNGRELGRWGIEEFLETKALQL
ncbi:aldehyde dehydrogenase family protein [Actinomadura sp. NAK00032]|uniref:aldehyde dehydrogenase family protein n=1 Tax=Actinomadura sp. NAK00032 TaxID=2742128 RepID=UPI001591B22B|nr:aldehyde dehydrogenase family protein [Actinomadura sp. NAK00032]QKW35586.1 aldehyde dehydrogenase family protein [Actinomadura sp. NAK00032]